MILRDQSSHVVSLSWLYGLLFPPWVCKNSSPAASIGMPLASISSQKKFFACRLRSAMTSAGTPSSPSQPQFQLKLSYVPSRFPWPFALVLLVVATRS